MGLNPLGPVVPYRHETASASEFAVNAGRRGLSMRESKDIYDIYLCYTIRGFRAVLAGTRVAISG